MDGIYCAIVRGQSGRGQNVFAISIEINNYNIIILTNTTDFIKKINSQKCGRGKKIFIKSIETHTTNNNLKKYQNIFQHFQGISIEIWKKVNFKVWTGYIWWDVFRGQSGRGQNVFAISI